MNEQTEPFDLVITNCVALRETHGLHPRFVPNSTIGIRGGTIQLIESGVQVPPLAIEVIDAQGMVAIPGLINCHTHAAMTLFRGVAEDVTIDKWFNDYVWPMEVNLTPEDVYLGTMLACAEMISSGVTSFADHYFYMDEVARAVDESGMRANLGWAFFSGSEPDKGLEISADFAERWNGRSNGRVTTSLAPHSTYLCNDADLKGSAEEARRIGIQVHLHAAENMEQTSSSLLDRGVTPIRLLEETGVLDAGALIAHGCGITPEDVSILGRHRDTVGIAHCPKVYMKYAFGPLTPIRELSAAGVAVGLGCDGVAANNTLDIFESMRLTALSQKHAEGDATWLTTAQAIHLATTQSAQVFGKSEEIGALEVGRRGDVVLMDMSAPHCQPVHNLEATLVYSSRASDVHTVIVEGQILKRDYELKTIDMDALRSEIDARLPALRDVSHGQSIQKY